MLSAIKLAAVVVIVLGSGAARGATQRGPARELPSPQGDAVFPLSIEAVQQAASPGPAHVELAKLSGDYDLTVRLHLKRDAKPTESAAVATLTSIAGGRFLVEEDALPNGRPTGQGRRIYGFNNGSQQYEAVWVYPRSTAILSLKGTTRDGGRTISFTGKYTSDVGALEEFHAVLRIIDQDHFIVEVNTKEDGEERVLTEEIYSRKKK